LSSLSTSNKSESIRSIGSTDSVLGSNATIEAAKRSLDESKLEEEKSTPRRKSSRTSLAAPFRTASDGQKLTPRRKSKATSLQSSTSSSNLPPGFEEAVKVGVRIRPLLEKDNEPRTFVLGPMENTIIRNVDGQEINAYQFTHVYGETSSTQQLYDEMVSDIVESVCEGRNGTVFTYGQTSTGKTYTMHGVLMAAGKDLFGMTKDGAECNEHDPSASTSLTSIRISCMELYNEELRDLLCPSKASLSIQEDRRGNVQITNLTERVAGSIAELMEVIQLAEENRTVGSTAMNEQSSRSHTIFRITYVKKEATNVVGSDDELVSVDSEDKENDSIRSSSSRTSQKVITTVSTLNLVDLAGSESVRVTGAKGERQKEGGKINQSLLTLSRVLAKLGKKDRGHINYRDSKLTRILKPSLSGNARMGCICCISPAVQFSEESKSTLDFASRTMLVTTNAKSNQTVEYDDALVQEFEREIERVKMETAKAEESRLQMQLSLQDAEDEIVCLKATIELQKSKVSSLERGKSDYSTQVEEIISCNEKNVEELLKEIDDLKARNQELEQNMDRHESEKKELREFWEKDRDAFDRECKLVEEELELLTENHAIELQNLKREAKTYKESNVEMEVMYKEMQAELESTSEGLQELRRIKNESDNNLLKRVAELERMNADLTGQLITADLKNQSSQDEIATLKSEMEALSEAKSEVEKKLEKEIQRALRRKEESKLRRQKFKGKLVGMTEILKEDLVQLSYQRDF